MSWKILWRVVLFLLYHINLMRVGQSLFGFWSEHQTLHDVSAAINVLVPNVGLLHVLGAMDAARDEYRPRLRAAALSSISICPGEAPDCVRAFQYVPLSSLEP